MLREGTIQTSPSVYGRYMYLNETVNYNGRPEDLLPGLFESEILLKVSNVASTFSLLLI